MLFCLRILVIKALFIFCKKLRCVYKYQEVSNYICKLNLLVFLKHNFEVSIFCFAWNGTLGDLLAIQLYVIQVIAFEVRERNSQFVLGVLCIIECPVQLIREVFRDCICVDTHLPRYEAIACVLPHFDALTHIVIHVSSAFIFAVCLRKAYILFLFYQLCPEEYKKKPLQICKQNIRAGTPQQLKPITADPKNKKI